MLDYNYNEFIDLPAYTQSEMNAAISVLQQRKMSGLDITHKFEEQYAEKVGVRYAIGCCNGTAAMLEALWACGVGEGTEIIAPAMTYWASVYPAYTLGATVKFADIDPDTLCISPDAIQSLISEKTRAIVVVHLYGHPCDMVSIMQIAHKYNIQVIEDFSHNHFGLYMGKICGSIGNIAIGSLMAEKPFPLAEGGIILTNERELYEKCCVFGHYRYVGCIENNSINYSGYIENRKIEQFIGAPIGSIKNRINQISSAIGIEKLKIITEQIAEADYAINYFLDELEKSGEFIGHRIKQKGCTMGGWYKPKVFLTNSSYQAEFKIELNKKGYACNIGHCYYDLSKHIYAVHGHKAYRNPEYLQQVPYKNSEECLQSEYSGIAKSQKLLVSAPRFSKYNKNIIDEYVNLYVSAMECVKKKGVHNDSAKVD